MAEDIPETPAPIPAPRENAHFIGHLEAEQRLYDAWQSGRLPHSWLITGPPGVGKATLAYRFARFVLAGGPSQMGLLGMDDAGDRPLHMDSGDPVFRRVAAGGHSDMLTLERGLDSTRKRLRNVIVVEDVRGAVSFLNLTSGEGGWRVVIVDCADEMNVNSANALLKTLEEPPSKALLLLVSHSPGGLPATIRSRCCRLNLAPLADEQVIELIGRYRPEIGVDEAATLARLAEGGIGKALAIAEGEGLGIYGEILGLLTPMPTPDPDALNRLAERVAGRDSDAVYRTAVELLRWWIWRVVRAQSRAGQGDDHGPSDEWACVENLSRLGGLAQWLEVWEKITRLFGQADGLNLDRKQVMLNAFHHIARVSGT